MCRLTPALVRGAACAGRAHFGVSRTRSGGTWRRARRGSRRWSPGSREAAISCVEADVSSLAAETSSAAADASSVTVTGRRSCARSRRCGRSSPRCHCRSARRSRAPARPPGARLGALGTLGDDADGVAGLGLDLLDQAGDRPGGVCDSSASLRTSSATTANPRPCSPARAASMAAFSASRFVCSAIPVMVSTISPIRSERLASWLIATLTSWEDSRSPYHGLARLAGGLDAELGQVVCAARRSVRSRRPRPSCRRPCAPDGPRPPPRG